MLMVFGSKWMGSWTCEPKRLGDAHAHADLDALDGLDAHGGVGESGVEFVAPVHAGAEADGHTEDVGFDESPHGVFVDLGLADGGAHQFAGGFVGAVDIAGVARFADLFPVVLGDLDVGTGGMDGAHEAEDFNVQFAQEAA